MLVGRRHVYVWISYVPSHDVTVHSSHGIAPASRRQQKQPTAMLTGRKSASSGHSGRCKPTPHRAPDTTTTATRWNRRSERQVCPARPGTAGKLRRQPCERAGQPAGGDHRRRQSSQCLIVLADLAASASLASRKPNSAQRHFCPSLSPHSSRSKIKWIFVELSNTIMMHLCQTYSRQVEETEVDLNPRRSHAVSVYCQY